MTVYSELREGIPGASEARKVREMLGFQGHGLIISLSQRKLNTQKWRKESH